MFSHSGVIQGLTSCGISAPLTLPSFVINAVTVYSTSYSPGDPLIAPDAGRMSCADPFLAAVGNSLMFPASPSNKPLTAVQPRIHIRRDPPNPSDATCLANLLSTGPNTSAGPVTPSAAVNPPAWCGRRCARLFPPIMLLLVEDVGLRPRHHTAALDVRIGSAMATPARHRSGPLGRVPQGGGTGKALGMFFFQLLTRISGCGAESER